MQNRYKPHALLNIFKNQQISDARHVKLSQILFLWLFFDSVLSSVVPNLKGPSFVIEPQHSIEFSNNTGIRVDCKAEGEPPPKIDWIFNNGKPVESIPGILELFPNGSIYFPAFSSDEHRKKIHQNIYKCKATNLAGVIISKDVILRGVIKQKFDVQVFDEYVIKGNTAVLRCQIPSYAIEFNKVSSWFQGNYDNDIKIKSGEKYAIMPNGDLYVFNVGENDSYKNFGCITKNKLTGEILYSRNSGRIIITEPKTEVQPRVRVEKYSRKSTKLGEDVTITCLAQGNPIPKYSWFKEENGKLTPISNSERFYQDEHGFLKIKNVHINDNGKYVCRILNSAGEDAIQVILRVTAPLTASISPKYKVGQIGESVIFSCNIQGYPIRKITWYQNGEILETNDHIKIMNNPERLIISNLTQKDKGIYQCFISNELDMAQAISELNFSGSNLKNTIVKKSPILKINEKMPKDLKISMRKNLATRTRRGSGTTEISPELIYTFSEQTLQPGPPISLKCVATGNPPPQFTWTLDGFSIPESTRFLVGQYVTIDDEVVSHVNISSVKDQDGGEYSCTAKNSVAQITHSARINVYGLPFIRLMPKISTVVGSDLVIKCPVAGYPIDSITWERDGTLLPTNRRQKVYNNGTLVIEQTQRGVDRGTYTCQATNRQKNTARRDVEVHVLLPPKILPMHSMENLLREGMRAAMSCQVLEGDLPLSFKWLRDGKEDLGPGTTVRRIDEYTASLVIEKIASYHSANYTCIVTNVAGTESFTVPLTVNVPPRWKIEPSDTDIVLGNDLVIDCQADGYPEPTVSWRKAINDARGEYKDFHYEPNISVHRNGSLKFTHITKESEGYYLCEAKNGISNGVQKVILIKVNSPAYFIQKSKQIYIKNGEQARIQCTALGDNPINIIWKVGQTRIKGNYNPKYSIKEQTLEEGFVSEITIIKVSRHDTGIITCSAINSFGHDEMKIHLIVQEPPEVPKIIRVLDHQSRSLQLTWTQPYTGNSPISSYIIQYKLVSELWDESPRKVVVPGSQTIATVASLQPATSYHIRILAENKLGISDPSEIIQVTTQEEAPSGQPRELDVEAKSSTELYVKWEPPDKQTWHGTLLGYSISYTPVLSSISQAIESIQQTNNMETRTRTVEAGPQYGGQVILDGLVPYTTYKVTVSALNSRGSGPQSDPYLARTDEGVPTMPPEKVGCTILTSTTVDVFWEPPPVEGRNGNIQGFKVSYYPNEEWYEKPEIKTKLSAMTHTTLSNLMKFTNYSISVLSYTRTGDGVTSQPVYCRTAEDVPMQPADLKAVMSSSNKILVSWLPPKQANGVIIGYTFYMRFLDNGKESLTDKHELNSRTQSYEVSHLKDGLSYKFWVTASTKEGEGHISKFVSVQPTSTVPARIVSFSQELITPWKQNISLLCRYVGIPTPKLEWKIDDNLLNTNNKRYMVKQDGTLLIKDVQYQDRGNYSCSVENRFGDDKILYMLIVRVPPDPPVLTVVKSDTDSIHVKWTTSNNNDIPILGFVINYKRENSDWEELQLGARESTHALLHLWCGTRYQLYMTAYNKIGTGLPCDIINTYTKGTPPIKPTSSQLLTVNSTAITVWLDSWADGGCPILYFTIEFKRNIDIDWISLSNHILPSDRVQTIADLTPGTIYHVKVVAHNNAGSNIGIYNVTTLAPDGSMVYPTILPSSDSSLLQTFYSMKLIWCICFGVLACSSFTMGCIYVKRRRALKQAAGEAASVARLQNQQNRDQQYSINFNSQNNHLQTVETLTFKSDTTPEYIEDVCPYATFQLAKTPYTESTFSGNVYSGPYHSVRGSFVYRDVPSNSENYKSRHAKEPEYTKVRRKPTLRLRDPHTAESQELCVESDNLGSTDSEVKKILTLHLPISEYDTHGSDSDMEGHTAVSSQEIVPSFLRQSRLSRASSHFMQEMNPNGEESSSSSDRSIANGTRKVCPHNRKLKTKTSISSANKKHITRTNSNIYEKKSEETCFSYNERSQPSSAYPSPSGNSSRYSDPRYSREHILNEMEHGSGRRLSRASLTTPYRLSRRESAFQIDV